MYAGPVPGSEEPCAVKVARAQILILDGAERRPSARTWLRALDGALGPTIYGGPAAAGDAARSECGPMPCHQMAGGDTPIGGSMPFHVEGLGAGARVA